jgi:hypothetical protein
MRSAAAGLFLAAVCCAQTRYLEIQLAPGITPENVFIRYRLDNDDLGGWVQPRPDVSSYLISTMREGRAATRIKALLYAPGCAIQTLDLPLSGSTNQKYSLTCRPLPNVSIAGVLTLQELLAGHEFNLQARYVARWAQPFFGFDPQLITTIPVGDVVNVSPGGRFKMQVPDFSQDSPGEIQIWAREKAGGKIVAQLLPAGPQAIKTRMGGLKLASEYPTEIVFVPCTEHPNRVQDAFGFTLRPKDNADACER